MKIVDLSSFELTLFYALVVQEHDDIYKNPEFDYSVGAKAALEIYIAWGKDHDIPPDAFELVKEWNEHLLPKSGETPLYSIHLRGDSVEAALYCLSIPKRLMEVYDYYRDELGAFDLGHLRYK